MPTLRINPLAGIIPPIQPVTAPGCSPGTLPTFIVFFSRFMDIFGELGTDFESKFSELALIFLYISIATFFLSFFEVGFWMWTGALSTSY